MFPSWPPHSLLFPSNRGAQGGQLICAQAHYNFHVQNLGPSRSSPCGITLNKNRKNLVKLPNWND